MSADSPIPVWPGWHRMPPPIEVRWSRNAWEALYPLGCQGWKAWPWEPEPREWPAISAEDVADFLRSLPKSVPLAKPVISWEQLRTITEANEAAEAVWRYGTATASAIRDYSSDMTGL